MENQLNDQPLKWIDRIRHGLKINKGYFVSDEILTDKLFKCIFTNMKEREQSVKYFVDWDVSFDNAQYVLRLGANTWKLVSKKSSYYSTLNINQSNLNTVKSEDSPIGHGTDHFFSLLDKECKDLININKILGKPGKGKDGFTIKLIWSCNNILINLIKKWTNIRKRNWTKNNNIRKYKKNKNWINDNEWNKLSLFEKIMKRWNFSDRHQCLVPWEEKKLSKEELLQFQEAKRQWRTKRKNELNGNTYKMEILNKFCHARIIDNILVKNLDSSYDDLIDARYAESNDNVSTKIRKKKINRGNPCKLILSKQSSSKY